LTPPPPLARLRLDRGGPPGATRRPCRRLENRFLGNNPWWMGAFDDGGERRDVSLTHPSEELKHLIVEEAHMGVHLADRQQSPRRDLDRRTEHPSLDGSAVERDRDEASGPRLLLFLEQVREGSIELEPRHGYADIDRARQEIGAGAVTRRLGEADRPCRPLPRRSPSARSARRRPSPCRWVGGGPGDG
jgi:hypothetical protein